MGITNFIDRIRMGEDEIAIGSSAYGICENEAYEANKIVNIPGFDLKTGTTIHVKFEHENSALNPTLIVRYGTGSNDITETKYIKKYNSTPFVEWPAGAIVSLTYDGTYWIHNLGISGILDIQHGGTGADSINKYGILYGNSNQDAYVSTITGNSGLVLIGGGANNAPNWYNGLTLSGAGTNDSPYLATFSGNISISGGITFDDSDTYGDEYTPIYWNNGVPEEVDVVKKYTFTIANGATTTIITPTNTNKAKSIVTEIVVDSGMAYLNGAISWNIPDTGDNKDKIVLSTTATSGAVSGYILVSIGG